MERGDAYVRPRDERRGGVGHSRFLTKAQEEARESQSDSQGIIVDRGIGRVGCCTENTSAREYTAIALRG